MKLTALKEDEVNYYQLFTSANYNNTLKAIDFILGAQLLKYTHNEEKPSLFYTIVLDHKISDFQISSFFAYTPDF